jgi:Protein of unknown function (DUF3309)
MAMTVAVKMLWYRLVVFEEEHRFERATGSAVRRTVPARRGKRHWGVGRARSNAALLRLAVRRHEMSLGTILLIIVVLILIGVIPSWPHSRGWGYGPSGGLGLVLLILIVLWLMGKI